MCMNFVQGGGCYATGEKCLLGLNGGSANNHDGKCELHGGFDVWVTQDNNLLVTDMGFPSDEPKQCLALGVNEALARRLASDRAQRFGTSVIMSQRRCIKCAKQYWITEHQKSSGLLEIGHANFCPTCLGGKIDEEMEKRLGSQRYWCG